MACAADRPIVCRLAIARPPLDSPDIQRNDVSTVAWEVARQLREMADDRGVHIYISDALPIVLIDPARLELILMNLVSNAIKYSDPKKLERRVDIEPGAVADERFACVVVRDNGLGIPASSREAIFRRFVRVHTDRDNELQVRGSGLGLAIATECTEAVGGSIQVESVEGIGSSFLVMFPTEPLPTA